MVSFLRMRYAKCVRTRGALTRNREDAMVIQQTLQAGVFIASYTAFRLGRNR